MGTRQLNFAAGPSKLPSSVLKNLKDSIETFKSSGMGICELGHRTSFFKDVLQETKDILRELLNLPDEYEILFMTGGGTAQFSAVPLNFLQVGEKAGYLISGHWAKAAYEEAKKFGKVEIVGSSEEQKFKKLPDLINVSEYLRYFHFTSNNTIYGTQFKDPPHVGKVPLVCDASSDILSRKLEISKYSLIYAGAQKNLGTPGVTLVFLNKEFLKNTQSNSSLPVPKILDYNTYLESDSLYNTPPVFPIFSVFEMVKWMKSEGGLGVIEERNNQKASLLYEFIDNSSFYEPYVSHANQTSRSKMNVVFSLKDPSKEKELLSTLKLNGIIGLEGHRSVGGLRASLYNAIEVSDVKKLVENLKRFETNP